MPDVRSIDPPTASRSGARPDADLFADPRLAAMLHAPGFAELPLDARIAALAEAQGGVVSRAQLGRLGVRRGGIDARVARGALHVVHRGVYAVGHPVVRGLGVDHAALLACPPGTPRSHRSAGLAWDLRGWATGRVEVTIPRWGASKSGLLVHRHRLTPEDVTRVDGLATTTVARTLFDLAEVLTREQHARAWQEAERLGVLDLGAVRAVAERSPGRRALKVVRPLLASRLPAGAAGTRSPLELDFLVWAAAWLPAFPLPQVNAWVAGFEVDAWYPNARLAVELDSKLHHDNDPAFERDRAKWNALVAADVVVFPLTARRLRREPAAVAGELSAALAARWR